MIKPIKISPINTSKHLQFRCKNCGLEDTITLTNYVVNTDDAGNALKIIDYNCLKCGKQLNDSDIKAKD